MTRALAMAVAVVTALALVVGSVAPWRSHQGTDGRIRIAWSARPQRIEHCRQLSDEELAGVPAHMRQRVQCEGRAARYGLFGRIDGVERLGDTLRGGGARHEGMIHLLRDLPVAPGLRRLVVEVRRLDSLDPVADSLGTLTTDRERRMEATRERVRREALPAEVRLDTVVSLGAREVVLIGYDPDGQRFTLRSDPKRLP
ncbi:MAG: hypothetical protein FJ206_03490 [Gemmatimonadetes bacterium]|nr:hypothetical protein [Gemmatimonadota bacterium]